MKPFFRWLGLAAGLFLVVTGAGCTKGIAPDVAKASKPVSLNVWGVVDDVDAYQPVLTAYHQAHPNVTINYRRLRLEEYEQALLEGFAEDRGPDIFLIHNDWTGKYLSKILPMPKTVKMAYSVVSGGIQKQQTWELRTENLLSLKDYKSQYADVVLRDTLRNVNVAADGAKPDIQQRPVGLPVSVDTLALYYNKDVLNAAGIATPPENWTEFQEQVQKIVKLDPQNNILQAATGLGTSRNVERAADILSVLMMQNGARMADENGVPTFHQMPPELADQREEPPSYSALTFYTDFANPAKQTYTWNAQQPNSLEAFLQGKTAFFFGYAYDQDLIKARAPRLNLGITKLPQIEGNPVKNYANYWYWVVAKKSKTSDVAWSFLNFLAQSDNSEKVLAITKTPAARKSLLASQLEDETVGVFASQVLTAQSWYEGNDPKTAEAAMLDLIDDIVGARVEMPVAMRNAVSKIAQTVTY